MRVRVLSVCHTPGLALELAELLGGPGGERLGLGGFGAAALRQQVVDERTNLHQLHHVFTERRAQVAEHTKRSFRLYIPIFVFSFISLFHIDFHTYVFGKTL